MTRRPHRPESGPRIARYVMSAFPDLDLDTSYRASGSPRGYDVFSSHTPLVGQYSFAGAVTDKLTYSLGPMLYWLLAPAAHVGAPQSFVYTMAVVNIACVLTAVALARRRGGVWLMLAAGAGIGLMCRPIPATNLHALL